MQLHNAGKLRLERLKAALRTGENGSGGDASGALHGLAQRFALAGFVHKEGQRGGIRLVEGLCEIGQESDGGDHAAAGLLGGFLGDALPAGDLFVRVALDARHAPAGSKEIDLRCARLGAFLENVVGLVAALGKTRENDGVHARLALAGDDLKDLGLDLVGRDLRNGAVVVLAAVAHDHRVADAKAQYLGVRGVLSQNKRRAPGDRASAGEKESRHEHILPHITLFLIMA